MQIIDIVTSTLGWGLLGGRALDAAPMSRGATAHIQIPNINTHKKSNQARQTLTSINQHREERALVHEAHGPHPWLKTKRGERTHPPLALTDRALLRPLS